MAQTIEERLMTKFGKSKDEAADLAWKMNNMHMPDQMKGSRTWLVPKKENPDISNPRDFRPVDPTNMGYKIFMDIMKERLGNYFSQFIKVESTEGNLLIMQDLVNKANAANKTLIAITTDYDCLAYEKFNRKALFESLIKYRVPPGAVNAIGNYFVDSTEMKYKQFETRVDVERGLRRTCPVSAIGLELVKHIIKEIMERNGKVYKIDNISLCSLWFADTSIILADSLYNARHNLKIFIDVSKSFGLDIDKDKSNVVIYNDKEGISQVENIKVKKSGKST